MHRNSLSLLLRHRCRSFTLALDLFDPAFGAHTPSLHLFTPNFLAACYQVVVGALKFGVGLVRWQRVNTLVASGEAKFRLVLDADFFDSLVFTLLESQPSYTRQTILHLLSGCIEILVFAFVRQVQHSESILQASFLDLQI